MPFLLAVPIPLKNPSGTDMTSAQGQETTRKMSARYTHVCASPVMRDGMSASKTAVKPIKMSANAANRLRFKNGMQSKAV